MSMSERSFLSSQQEEVETMNQTAGNSNCITTSFLTNNPQLAEKQGDTIQQKRQKIFRIGFININGLTHTARNPKNNHIKEIINLYNFDHFGLAETNCNWKVMEESEKWHERARGLWKKSKSVVTHNANDISSEIRQPGGVLSVTLGSAIGSAIEQGKDTALGR